MAMKVYPGRRAGGVVADALAANELNTHLFLQVRELDSWISFYLT